MATLPSLVVRSGIETPVETMYRRSRSHLHRTTARIPRKERVLARSSAVRPLIDLRKGKIEASPELVERDRESAPMVARFLGLGYFVIDRGYEKRGVVSYLEQVLPVERWYEDESVIVLETRREELPPDPRVLEAGAPSSRQHFESGFLRAESEGDASFRWANRERSTILFRRRPRIAPRRRSVPPGLPSVEARLDGQTARKARSGWQEVALPPTGPERGRGRAAHAPLVIARRGLG
jgi:hypothetical protein